LTMRATKTTQTFVICLMLLLGSACVDPDARLRELAAPHVACSEAELHFVEGRGNAGSAVYLVECDGGQRYRCISRGRPFGEEPDTVCSPDTSARLDPQEHQP
jgi:hypothetical protein